MQEQLKTHAEIMTVGPYSRPSREIGGLGIAAVLYTSKHRPEAFTLTAQDAHEAAYAGFPAVQALSVREQW